MSSRDPTPLAGPIQPLDLGAESITVTEGLSASIGKKYLMGWTGILWSLFLVAHLLGNLAIFVGAEALNAYAHKLASLGPLLYAMELGLVGLLLCHAILGVLVTLQNNAARPAAYGAAGSKGGQTLASNTMIWTGLFVFVFLIVHLLTIKYASHDDFLLKGETVPDIYKATVTLFASPFYVVFYVVGVCLLGLHVSHGIQSAFRTIGVHGPRITPKIERIGLCFGVFVALGYASFPLWGILFGQGGGA
jgi:succinate dehydrogenase / fumarate reductase cytochrome b subunit